MVNPRKAYPIDPGLISVYEPAGRDNLGHALETAVLIELQRRGCEVRYFRTIAGNEVDFRAVDATGKTWLIQACADASDPETFEREVRSLLEAKSQYPEANALLLLLDPLSTGFEMPVEIRRMDAIEWFLEKVH
jgi:predicted AAA+ superfamily ATPase